jgi:hypothetical protein
MTVKAAIVAGIAGACMFAGAAYADVYLKGEDVAKLIVGKTIEGQFTGCAVGRTDFAEFYTKDGKIKGRERPCAQAGSWKRYGGVWRVKDGKFCVTLGSERSSGCFDYQVDKDGNLRRDSEKGTVSFKIYDGNPDHL